MSSRRETMRSIFATIWILVLSSMSIRGQNLAEKMAENPLSDSDLRGTESHIASETAGLGVSNFTIREHRDAGGEDRNRRGQWSASVYGVGTSIRLFFLAVS